MPCASDNAFRLALHRRMARAFWYSTLWRNPMLESIRDKVAIAGVGTAGLGEAHGYTEMELLAQAATRAVRDAGLTMADIDGICTSSSSATMWAMPVVEYLGLRPRFIESTMLGGSSFVAHLLPAMLALASGQ